MERIQIYSIRKNTKVSTIKKNAMDIYSYEMKCILFAEGMPYVTVYCSTISFRNKRHSGECSIILTNDKDNFVAKTSSINFETKNILATKGELEEKLIEAFNQARASINSLLYDLDLLRDTEEVGKL
ncbi:MAG: hypothetical protein AMQ74_01683 [Candidatus Methanofastidiosum methylothiophilum]|uniref:Uncharacterized protein n=1 Tax=Candidatus Methanofastidiosum methylothiophilum TaxID=1705564 RepID=A0A150IR24_9EURY|nr:MAG: hypothetical protein AMQ74_01683 [Candidatus Methanofastidiosum methylthiophilus]